jgi:hypothetical protein
MSGESIQKIFEEEREEGDEGWIDRFDNSRIYDEKREEYNRDEPSDSNDKWEKIGLNLEDEWEDTDAEDGTDPDAGGAVKSRRRTRSTVGKKSASAVAAAIYAVKAAEQKKKKKRKRKAASPQAVVTPSISTPRSREVESEEEEESEKEKNEAIEELAVAEDRPARRSESPAAKRQQELV